MRVIFVQNVFYLLVCLFERQSERGRDREESMSKRVREMLSICLFILQTVCSTQGWACLKLEAENFVKDVRVAGTQVFEPTYTTSEVY